MMVCVPTERLVVGALVAMPPLRSTGLPKLLPSITNWIVPEGVPPPLCGVAMAAKLTLCPNTDGLTEELTLIMVATGGRRRTTDLPDSVPLLPRKPESPL